MMVHLMDRNLEVMKGWMMVDLWENLLVKMKEMLKGLSLTETVMV